MKAPLPAVDPYLVRRVVPAGVTNTDGSVSWPSRPVQGHLLMAVHMARTAYANVTCPSGWTEAFHQDRGTTACLIFLYKIAGASESLTVAWTTTTSVFQETHLLEYDGMAAVPLDRTVSNDGGASGITTLSTGTTAATTQAFEIAVAAWMADNGATDYTSFTNNFRKQSQISGPRLCTARKILTATGTVESTATWTTSRAAVAGIATFKCLATVA